MTRSDRRRKSRELKRLKRKAAKLEHIKNGRRYQLTKWGEAYLNRLKRKIKNA